MDIREKEQVSHSSKKSSVLLQTPNSSFDSYGLPYRLNYIGRYSLGIRLGHT